jgi:uncharacterized membrane protein YfhO
LNVKYVIQTDSTGASVPVVNPGANGNAWFVKQLKVLESPDAVMKALKGLDTKNVAIFHLNKVGSEFKNSRLKENWSANGTIQLDEYKPNYLKYTAVNQDMGVAVFSEIYYDNGWNAYVDGKLTDHFVVNYVLRAMVVPAGKHTIEFKFEPQVVKTGSTITLISFIGMGFLLIGGVYFENKKREYIK